MAQIPPARISTDLDSFRSTLPVFQHKEEIIRSINSNRTLLITGETGSGKTTQVCNSKYDTITLKPVIKYISEIIFWGNTFIYIVDHCWPNQNLWEFLIFFFITGTGVYYLSVTNLKKNKPKFWGLTIFLLKLIVDSTDDTRWWHSKQQEMSHTLYTAQKNSGTKYRWKSVSRERGEDRTNRRLPDPSGEQVRPYAVY